VTYKHNDAREEGGAATVLQLSYNSSFIWQKLSSDICIDNKSKYGGALYSKIQEWNMPVINPVEVGSNLPCNITFDNGHSIINIAAHKRAVNSINYQQQFQQQWGGGAVSSFDSSSITFDGNSVVTFSRNVSQY